MTRAGIKGKFTRRERRNTLAKIDENAVPCLDGCNDVRGWTSCRVYRIRLVSGVAEGCCATNLKEEQGGLAKSTLPGFDMLRETTGTYHSRTEPLR
jgi:hypothetical protein